MGILITVSGAVGGIGTSTFAWAIAQQVAHLMPSHTSVLIDAQASGPPLDLIAGAERVAGIRWSQVRVRSADIAHETVLAALPVHCGVSLLSSDEDATADGVALDHLVGVLRSESCVVVLDISARDARRESLAPEIDLLLVPPTMGGIVSAHRSLRPDTRVVLVETGHADVVLNQVAEYLARPELGSVRWQRAVIAGERSGAGTPRSTDVMKLAASVLEVHGHGTA